jgi:DNA-binding CsgD family transcriptional regulator/tetratricopeptide (TPR) repeat protein
VTDDARLAHHAEGADDGPAVLRFATRAAERAGQLAAHREAAAQYQRALRFVADEESPVVADLYDRFAAECSIIDRWEEAAAAREQALYLWRAVGHPLREGDTLRRLSRTMFRLSRGNEAAECAEAAIGVLEPHGSSAELAWAWANLANQYMLDGRYDDGIDVARRAQAVALELGLPDVLSDALNSEGAAHAYTGRPWEELLERALTVALDGGADEQAGRAYSNLSGLYVEQHRFAEAERYIVEGIRFGEEHDLATFLTCVRGRRTTALAATGRWDEALAAGRPLLRLGVASPINRLEPMIGMATVLARRSDPAAMTLCNEAVELAHGTAEPMRISTARVGRAEAYWLAGRPEPAIKDLEAIPRDRLQDGWTLGAIAVWLRRCGAPVPVMAAIAAPFAATLDGDFLAAERLWTELESPYEAALALFDSGTPGGLQEAQSRFDALGATAAVTAVRREMRRLGIRPVRTGARPSTRSHPLGLTVREQEVLDLLVDGRTNNAIAETLFISAKTVDHHVSAVLRKLGVSSRGEAAAEARRQGAITA